MRTIQDPATAEESRHKAAEAPLTSQVDEGGLRRAVRSLADEGAVLVELAADGALSREITRVAPELPVVRLFADPTRQGVLTALAELYSLGADLDWSRYYAGAQRRRIEAPTYPFDADEVSCWCRPPGGPLPSPGGPARRGGHRADGGSGVGRHPQRPGAAAGRDLGGHPQGRECRPGLELLRPRRHVDRRHHGAASGPGALRRAPHLQRPAPAPHAAPTRHADGRPAGRRTGAGRLDDHPGAAPRPVRPLSLNQEQLWYLDRLTPGTALYNIPVPLRYTGELDLDAVRAALSDVVGSDRILRTRILDEDGRPYALDAVPEPHLAFIDLAALPDEQRRAELSRVMTEEATAPFASRADRCSAAC